MYTVITEACLQELKTEKNVIQDRVTDETQCSTKPSAEEQLLLSCCCSAIAAGFEGKPRRTNRAVPESVERERERERLLKKGKKLKAFFSLKK
jgi:hypothetical protein